MFSTFAEEYIAEEEKNSLRRIYNFNLLRVLPNTLSCGLVQKCVFCFSLYYLYSGHYFCINLENINDYFCCLSVWFVLAVTKNEPGWWQFTLHKEYMVSCYFLPLVLVKTLITILYKNPHIIRMAFLVVSVVVWDFFVFLSSPKS